MSEMKVCWKDSAPCENVREGSVQASLLASGRCPWPVAASCSLQMVLFLCVHLFLNISFLKRHWSYWIGNHHIQVWPYVNYICNNSFQRSLPSECCGLGPRHVNFGGHNSVCNKNNFLSINLKKIFLIKTVYC